MTLQRAFGTIPRLIGKGTCSRVSPPTCLLSLSSLPVELNSFTTAATGRSNETSTSRTINFPSLLLLLESNSIHFDPSSKRNNRFNDSIRSTSRHGLCVMYSIDLPRTSRRNGRNQKLYHFFFLFPFLLLKQLTIH